MAKPHLTHTFTLTTGDPSRDGHNQSDTVAFLSNRSLDDIRKAYRTASRLYDMDLEKQCEEYEDSKLTEQYWHAARAAFHAFPKALDLDCLADPDNLGYDEDAGHTYSRDFMELYFYTAKLVDPELEWEEAPTGSDEFIGGYGLYY